MKLSREALISALPDGGLFADTEWIWPGKPFAITPALAKRLDRLGHQLLKFQEAIDLLYYQSVKGTQPEWIARYLDLGKPAALIDIARNKNFREHRPGVIRPDLLLSSPETFSISEIDSVPGGIGLTAWLSRTFAEHGFEVLGGANGMLDGFSSILPGGDILVSQEAAAYRPEMDWLASTLNAAESGDRHWQVKSAESATDLAPHTYRFFELFDIPNIPALETIAAQAVAGATTITPPLKPWLEEKLAFALFWNATLREFWHRQLGGRYFRDLQEVIPFTWVLDPEPLPQQAVYPHLDIHSWEAMKSFSQKERELVIKASGFSELAWGSRSVTLGHDVSQEDWSTAIDEALGGFASGPYILQVFHHTGLIPQEHFGADGGLQIMEGRVRLCPYYFTKNHRVTLAGALATICPSDKKLIHGMKDAILAPCHIQ